ncbi:hypothetical protein B296_00007281 [Ensete ventricosum]|uniref:Uncharacterized protein n=1 Tax=Ensete ventricosum TaxID=4639 RepID=A0A427B8M9_ENSVE|nr:hypothetical protein B296_00007281 [Ensete ventricosum]
MKSIFGGRLREKEEEGEEEKGDKREISALPWFLVRSVAHERSFAGELPSPHGRRGEKGEGNSPCGNEATPRLLAWEQNDASPPRAGRNEAMPRLPVENEATDLSPRAGRRRMRRLAMDMACDFSLNDSVSYNFLFAEAMEFRDWCVNEWIRLTGTNDYDSFILPFVSDTSFLEFCIKQSTSEVEMLLRENLGSMDPNHEFIDKFLNYKEFLPSDVLEIAFQLQKSHNPSTGSASHRHSNTTTATEADGAEEGLDGPSKGQGKKKGKKGQKVSASILGFNVISNRIMMGEIQSIQD